MPTPIGHSLISLIFFKKFKHQLYKLSWYDIFVFILLGNIADIDFLPGYLIGFPSKFHHTFTHSIVFSLFIGSAFGFIYYLFNKKSLIKVSLIFCLVCFSHVLADFFGVDTSFPFGVQMFWPIWDGYIISPVPIFLDITRSSNSSDFFSSIFNYHNLKAVVVEIVICLPFLFLIKKNRNHK